MATSEFSVGQIVKHKAKFLKSIGWYTDVPRNGIVRGFNSLDMPRVQWCDSDDETGVAIHPGNIMPDSKADYSGL